MVQKRSHVVRMLAVGGPAEDKILRLTRGEFFTCCHGSDKEHQQLSDFCLALQQLLASMGQPLDAFTPDELGALLREYVQEDSGA